MMKIPCYLSEHSRITYIKLGMKSLRSLCGVVQWYFVGNVIASMFLSNVQRGSHFNFPLQADVHCVKGTEKYVNPAARAQLRRREHQAERGRCRALRLESWGALGPSSREQHYPEPVGGKPAKPDV